MGYSVYALRDPRTGDVRYIGTSGEPKRRYTQHLTDKQSNKGKIAWIEDMKKDNVKPALEILEEFPSWDEAMTREDYWVHHYLESGSPLTNILYPGKQGPDLIIGNQVAKG